MFCGSDLFYFINNIINAVLFRTCNIRKQRNTYETSHIFLGSALLPEKAGPH